MDILDKLFKQRKARPFTTWQIELTTRCPLRCTMCIKDEYQDWQRKEMDLDGFKSIAPCLKDVQNVVLEGWGESLLYRHLIECVLLIKQQGAEVGFVTSGMGLDEKYAHDLISAGIDFMGFSLSGATGRTHNAIRINSDFDTLIHSITTMTRLIAEKKATGPRIHIVYLMLRENIHEVPSLIDLAGTTGIRQVILINIVHITNKRQDQERVFTCERGDGEPYRAILEEAARRARKYGIDLVMPALYPCDVAVCAEDPLKNLYISADGEVSPCVYLGPPIPSPFRRIFCGVEHSTERISFGNVFRENPLAIWESESYSQFRERFILRKRCFDESYRALLEMRRTEQTPLPEPPEPCRTCHKMLGV